MIFPPNLNLDRLHAVAETLPFNLRRNRGQGTTVAYLTLMLAEVELGDRTNHYLYVGETREFTDRISVEFRRLVGEKFFPDLVELDSNYSHVSLYTGQRFSFINVDRINVALRGNAYNRIFFDVTEKKMRELDNVALMEEILENMQVCVCINNGDII